MASPLAHTRIAIVVPRHRHSAVDRNRLKRRLREIVRLELLPALATMERAVDLVIRTRPPAYDSGYTALSGELTATIPRIRRVVEPAAPPTT